MEKRLIKLQRKVCGTSFNEQAQFVGKVARICFRILVLFISTAVMAVVALAMFLIFAIKKAGKGLDRIMESPKVPNFCKECILATIMAVFLFAVGIGGYMVVDAIDTSFQEEYVLTEHTVGYGENVWSISKIYSNMLNIKIQEVEHIIYQNNDIGQYIHPGDVLIVPYPKDPEVVERYYQRLEEQWEKEVTP